MALKPQLVEMLILVEIKHNAIARYSPIHRWCSRKGKGKNDFDAQLKKSKEDEDEAERRSQRMQYVDGRDEEI